VLCEAIPAVWSVRATQLQREAFRDIEFGAPSSVESKNDDAPPREVAAAARRMRSCIPSICRPIALGLVWKSCIPEASVGQLLLV
jgi:hypothetical protein